jgi:hypothetical protein
VRYLELSFHGSGFTAPVTMLWDRAPRTCAAVWDMLDEPLTGRTHHAVFSGYEVYLYCRGIDLPLENHVVFPRPGYLVYYYLPAGRHADNIAHGINLDGHHKDVGEIAIWYGEGDLRRMTDLGVRGNLFATIDAGHDELFDAGLAILDQGRQTASLRRREDGPPGQ